MQNGMMPSPKLANSRDFGMTPLQGYLLKDMSIFIQCKRTHNLLWIFWNSLQFRLIQRKGTYWKDWEWDREKELRSSFTMIWAKLSQYHNDMSQVIVSFTASRWHWHQSPNPKCHEKEKKINIKAQLPMLFLCLFLTTLLVNFHMFTSIHKPALCQSCSSKSQKPEMQIEGIDNPS